MYNPQLNIEAAIQAWYNEKNYYDYDTGNCQSGKACGHYTQVNNLEGI